MKKVGIIGAAGYTGGELLRVLLNHSQVEIAFAFSKSNAGNPLWLVHPDLLGETTLHFSEKANPDVDVLFLCLGHGESKKFLEENPSFLQTAIIDLSQDFRIKGKHDFVYGLPEINKNEISHAKHIANPGCFATAIQLALLPLAAANVLTGDIHISGTTGSTGAGQSLSETSHHSWRNNNYSAYKSFQHQHLSEIGQTLGVLQAGFKGEVNFIPNRGSFTRGIYATIYLDCSMDLRNANELFKEYYLSHPFVHVSEQAIDVKQVVNTNKCLLFLEKHKGKLLIHSAIDNLLKGASGQAVQNMNLMFGLEETTGIKLKAVAF